MNYRGQVDSGEIYRPYTEFAGKLGYGALRTLSPSKVVRLRRRIINLSGWTSKKRYVDSFSGAYGYYKEIYSAELFSHPAKVLFEQRVLYAPSNPERCVAKMYGADFGQEPSYESRRGHIDLKKSYF